MWQVFRAEILHAVEQLCDKAEGMFPQAHM